MDNNLTEHTLTQDYYNDKAEVKIPAQLFYASHWQSPGDEKLIRLTPVIKSVYAHRLRNYSCFAVRGRPYTETIEGVCRKLGMSESTVIKAQDLLVQMGLFSRFTRIVSGEGMRRSTTYTVNGLDALNGSLINDRLLGWAMTLEERKETDTSTHSAEEWKIYRSNVDQYQKLKQFDHVYVLTQAELDEMIKRALNSAPGDIILLCYSAIVASKSSTHVHTLAERNNSGSAPTRCNSSPSTRKNGPS